jgi:GH24 family phage-related lysozyme (muramidase)
MRLIENWKSVSLKAWSMWANYLGVGAIVTPEMIYVLWSIDTSPRIWWFFGIAFLALGIVGRLLDQGIDRTTMKCGGAVTLAAFMAVAVPLVAKWEGKRNASYQDIVGVWTICYGHTRTAGPGQVKTDAECEALLAAELKEYREGLHRYFSQTTLEKRLTPERDAAFTSLAFNVGISGAGKSTATRRLNAGNIAGACEALTWWNRAGGRVIRGLVNRRKEEKALCLA